MSACDKCGWSKQGRCRCGDGTSVWSRDQAAKREGARAGEVSNITKPKYVWDGYNVWGERNGTPKDVEAHRAKMGLTAGRGSDMGSGRDDACYPDCVCAECLTYRDNKRAREQQDEADRKVGAQLRGEPRVVSVRQEAWVNGEKVFVSSPKPEVNCAWTMCNRKDCVCCHPPAKPAAQTWAVGQKVRTPAGEDGVIVFIRGPNAWIECGTAQHLWPLSELTRPAPKRRTVTVHEWRRQGRKQTRWFSGGPDANQKEWEPTGRTHEFEMEET